MPPRIAAVLDAASIGLVAGVIGALALRQAGWTPLILGAVLAAVGGLLASRDRNPLASLGKPALAALLVFHVVAVTALAAPSPPSDAGKKSTWDKPMMTGEVAGWAERLTRWGFETDPGALGDALYRGCKSFLDTRRALLEPIRPYARHTGARQGWHMFLAPQRHPSKLQIRIREDGDWRLAYEARHPDHDWLARPLDHERFRSPLYGYGWGGRKAAWTGLCTWVGKQAAAEFPLATEVECRFVRYRTRSPQEVKDGVKPKGKRRRSIRLSLKDLR